MIDLPRISAYVIENFQNRMIQLFSIENIDKFWLQPTNFYIDDKLKISLFYPEACSLYELFHSDSESPNNFSNIMKNETN